MATREVLPVRRCLRGLVDSVKDEAILGVERDGVDGRESFDLACDDERRFLAIVTKPGNKNESCAARG